MQREGSFREIKLHNYYEKALRKASPRAGGSYSPCSQACAQEIAARRPTADQAQGRPGSCGKERSRTRPPVLIFGMTTEKLQDNCS
jgi:hypothetical protein